MRTKLDWFYIYIEIAIDKNDDATNLKIFTIYRNGVKKIWKTLQSFQDLSSVPKM